MAILANMRLQSIQAAPGVAGSLRANAFVTMPDAVRYTVIFYVFVCGGSCLTCLVHCGSARSLIRSLSSCDSWPVPY